MLREIPVGEPNSNAKIKNSGGVGWDHLRGPESWETGVVGVERARKTVGLVASWLQSRVGSLLGDWVGWAAWKGLSGFLSNG